MLRYIVPLSLPLGWRLPFRACKSHSFLKDSSILCNVCRRFLTCLLGNTFPISWPNHFQVSRKNAQIIYDQTSSPRFDKVFKKWEEGKWANAANNSHTSSSWSSLPTNLLCPFIGPKCKISSLRSTSSTSYPVSQIRDAGGSVSRTCAILCHSKNVKEIYYQYGDDAEAPPAEFASDAARS